MVSQAASSPRRHRRISASMASGANGVAAGESDDMKDLSKIAYHVAPISRVYLETEAKNSSATACRSPRSRRPLARRSMYSAPTLRERYRALDNAFGDHPHAIHYALKANSTLAIARLIRELGGSADANSIWELELARKAGFAPADIVFTGVGKSRIELECAVPLGLKAINVESAGEIARVEAIAEQAGVVARVAVRVNPDIDAESHPHISTGLRANNVRRPNHWQQELVRVFGSGRASRLVAIHVHVGSQITTLEPLPPGRRIRGACVQRAS